MPLSDRVRKLLRCPYCGASLRDRLTQFECVNAQCGREFPVLNGIPILLNEASGLFGLQDNREKLAVSATQAATR